MHRRVLVDLGLSIFDFPVDAFVPPDTVRISKLGQDLRSFKPQMALELVDQLQLSYPSSLHWRTSA
jgi:hypothetical protein